MISKEDFYGAFPVIHDNADMRNVYERLAFKWNLNRVGLLNSLSVIYWNKDAVQRFNQSV